MWIDICNGSDAKNFFAGMSGDGEGQTFCMDCGMEMNSVGTGREETEQIYVPVQHCLSSNCPALLAGHYVKHWAVSLCICDS